MVNELKQSQLARIVVPAITDAEYSTGLADAFDKINDNFKKIASLPFLQGVQGDSYQLEEYPIWEKDTTENWILTEDGKILLDSIFGIDTTRDGNSFSDIRACIGQLMPKENGVSPIDFFKNGNDIINNSLYFYVIKDDTGNIIEKQLGQYYYFVDGRLKEVGNIYNSENAGSVLSAFNDYTGFYQYRYNPKSYNQKYLKVEILPSIYYDQNKNDICWKFNGNETGISAIGVKGADGKDAELSIVKIDLNNESGVYSNNSTSGKVVGILNTSSNSGEVVQWITDAKYFKTGKALIYMSGKIPVENTEESTVNPLSGETEVNEVTINDFAYGEIIKQNDEYIAYWEPNCIFSKILTNNAFTQYFYNMGTVSYTNNAPFFLAIPSIQNRDSSTEEAKQHAHIIKGYEGDKDNNIESLNIFHSDIAFDEVGNQQMNATESSNKLLNIKNYDVNILKTLTTKGKITGESGLEVVGVAEFISDLNVGGALGVTGVATFSNDLAIEGALGVIGNAIFNNDLSIGHTLSVSGALGVEGTATFSNDLTVSGALGVEGNVIFNNDLSIGHTLSVSGALGVEGTVEFKNGLTVDGGLYAKTKKPTSVIYNGSANGLSNVLIGHNDPGNATFDDFPKDLDKGGYPLVVKSLQSDGINENGGAMVFGIGDIYALSGNNTTGYSAGTLCLNHRTKYRGDVQIGKNLNVGDNDTGGNVTIYSTDNSNGKLIVGNGAVINSNSTGIYGLKVSGASGPSYYDGGVGLFVKGGTGGPNLKGGTGLIVQGGDEGGTGKIGLGLKVERGGAEIYSGTGATTDANYLKVNSSEVVVGGTNCILNVYGDLICGGSFSVESQSSNFGGDIHMEDGGELTAYLDNVDINEFLNVGSQLVVNSGGTNSARSNSKICGYNAYGGTTIGGIGLEVYGGSGKETNATGQGNGGVGLIVRGGTAGNFTGSTADYAGYGGTGLVVYGGQAGSGPGTSNTGHTGAAIKTYGNIKIGDRTGSYTSTLSSNSSGFKIDKHINIPGIGNTKYQTTEVSGTTANNSITLDSGSRVYIYDAVHTGDSNLTITVNKAKDNIDFPIYLLFKTGIKTGVVGSGNKTINIVVGSKTFNTGNIYNNEGYTSGLLFVIFDKFCFVQCNYSPVNSSNYTNGGQRVLY